MNNKFKDYPYKDLTTVYIYIGKPHNFQKEQGLRKGSTIIDLERDSEIPLVYVKETGNIVCISRAYMKKLKGRITIIDPETGLRSYYYE